MTPLLSEVDNRLTPALQESRARARKQSYSGLSGQVLGVAASLSVGPERLL
jgi:hypothetical protein